MDFFIKQNATLPYLELELIEDGYGDRSDFYDKLQNALVTFSMESVEGCVRKIICRPMQVIEDDCGKNCSNCQKKYKIVYPWRARDTSEKGRFLGNVEIDFLDGCGKLIVPIRESLYINII
jgi:hypothetical protein